MKFSFYIFFCFLLIFLMGSSPEKVMPLEGTWDLISGHSIRPDTTTQNFPRSDYSRQIKFIGKNFYCWVRQDTSMKISGFGAGSYTLKGNTYTENLEMFYRTTFIGHTLTFKVEIKEDTLIQSGKMSLEDMGIGSYNYNLYEVYTRIK
jgi:hypothetical protein